MPLRTLQDLDVAGKRVLVRVDFNVPLKEGRVADDTRIRATLPTLKALLAQDAVLILMSHLGRPKGKVVPELRLDPVAPVLQELLGRPVRKLADCVGPEVEAAVAEAAPGDVILLENLRFHPGERKNDPAFADALARLGEAYVNDAFGTCHRAHASVVGVPQRLPGAAGLLVEAEVEALSRVRERPMRPFVAVIGGAKVSDKLQVLEALLDRADRLLIGGGMANTFLLAQGYDVAESLAEPDLADEARRLLARARERGTEVGLPVDVVVADRFAADAQVRTVPVDRVPAGWRILDVGPETVARYRALLEDARTVFWNGPLGVFELEPFAAGTRAMAEAVAALEAAYVVVGGGDSVAAVHQAGVADRIDHISTGGGASLEFVQGKALPGLVALGWEG